MSSMRSLHEQNFLNHVRMEDGSILCLRMLKSFDIKTKHPDCSPVYVEPSTGAKLRHTVQFDKQTMVVPNQARLSSVIEKLRAGLDVHEVNANAGYLFFVKDGARRVLPSPSDIISTLYKKYMDVDGFLHLVIDREDIFG